MLSPSRGVHQPILTTTLQIQGSILYCIKLRIHGTSSSILPNHLLLTHMLEYVEQHPTLCIFRKNDFQMMNMWCIANALRRLNIGEGHMQHTHSDHSPAKLPWWSPLLDNLHINTPNWSQCILCESNHHQPILNMTVQIQRSILYCIKLRIHGTSSSILPNRLLLTHMLEYVEQHPTLYIFR